MAFIIAVYPVTTGISTRRFQISRRLPTGGQNSILDAWGFSRLIVAYMKKIFFAGLAAVAIIATGCVHTVTDSSTFAVSYGKDSVAGRYQRPLSAVYDAANAVIQTDGVLLTEYVPHDYTNAVRSLQGRVNDCKVWIRVEQVEPRITQVDVQARTKWGRVDLDLVHEIEKEIAIKLATQ